MYCCELVISPQNDGLDSLALEFAYTLLQFRQISKGTTLLMKIAADLL